MARAMPYSLADWMRLLVSVIAIACIIVRNSDFVNYADKVPIVRLGQL